MIWAIAAKALGSLGAIAGVLVAGKFLLDRHDAAIEQQTLARVAAAEAQATAHYERQVRQLSSDHASLLARQAEDAREVEAGRLQEITLLQSVIDDQTRANPLLAGDRFYLSVARIMCEAQAADNLQDRSACNLAAAAAGTPRQSLAFAFTPKQAEYLLAACEDFKLIGGEGAEHADTDEWEASYPGLDYDSACRWSVTGFTASGSLAFLAWLERFGSYALVLRQDSAGTREILREARELYGPPGPEADPTRGAAVD